LELFIIETKLFRGPGKQKFMPGEVDKGAVIGFEIGGEGEGSVIEGVINDCFEVHGVVFAKGNVTLDPEKCVCR